MIPTTTLQQLLEEDHQEQKQQLDLAFSAKQKSENNSEINLNSRLHITTFSQS